MGWLCGQKSGFPSQPRFGVEERKQLVGLSLEPFVLATRLIINQGAFSKILTKIKIITKIFTPGITYNAFPPFSFFFHVIILNVDTPKQWISSATQTRLRICDSLGRKSSYIVKFGRLRLNNKCLNALNSFVKREKCVSR